MRFLLFFAIFILLTSCGFRQEPAMEMERMSKDVLESKTIQGIDIEIRKIAVDKK